jgi:hypothetical protein
MSLPQIAVAANSFSFLCELIFKFYKKLSFSNIVFN